MHAETIVTRGELNEDRKITWDRVVNVNSTVHRLFKEWNDLDNTDRNNLNHPNGYDLDDQDGYDFNHRDVGSSGPELVFRPNGCYRTARLPSHLVVGST